MPVTRQESEPYPGLPRLNVSANVVSGHRFRNAMKEPARRDVEALLDQMMTRQYPDSAPRPSYDSLVVSQVRLTINTGVSAKGL